jgi:hypothetical protein
VFAFLSLDELHTALSVSKDWRDAAGTMRSIRARLSQSKAKPLNVSNVCASRLARHIDELVLEEQWSSELLRIIFDRMSQLRTLVTRAYRVPLLPKDDCVIAFPRNLTRLDVTSEIYALAAARLLAALPPLHSLAEIDVGYISNFGALGGRVALHAASASSVHSARVRLSASAVAHSS